MPRKAGYITTRSRNTSYYQSKKFKDFGYCQRKSCGKQVLRTKLKRKTVKLYNCDNKEKIEINLFLCKDCYEK